MNDDISELEQESRLMRARNARLEAEVTVLTEMVRVLSDKVNELQILNQPTWFIDSKHATPQQRTWVGLTPLNIEDEYVRNYLWERALIAIDDPCCRSHPHENMNEYCQRRTELARYQAKLKEKNT